MSWLYASRVRYVRTRDTTSATDPYTFWATALWADDFWATDFWA